MASSRTHLLIIPLDMDIWRVRRNAALSVYAPIFRLLHYLHQKAARAPVVEDRSPKVYDFTSCFLAQESLTQRH